MSKPIKGLARNKAVYSAARFIGGWYIKRAQNFTFEPYTPKSDAFILIPNHTTAFDPLFEGIAFPQYLRYVASEHLLRKGLSATLLKFLINPIPRRRGADSSQAVELIKETLQSGVNVCIHAEGYVSMNGVTGHISPRTAEMVKEAGQGMITYKFIGGYFKWPRWAADKRKGPIHGSVVHEYAKEDIARMSVEEIEKAIRDDLYVNAYDYQRKDPKPYISDRSAEYLETLLYLCPECGKLSTLHSKGDKLYCDCGYTLTYNKYGFFEGDKVYFDNTYDWDKWQTDFLRSHIEEYASCLDTPIISDEKQLLFILDGSEKKLLDGNCTIALYGNRLVFTGEKTYEFMLSDISRMAMGGSTRMSFTAGENFYDVNSSVIRSSLKYYVLYRLLRGEEYYI